LVFHELTAPTGEEVAEVARRTAERIKKVLRKHGRELDPEMADVEAPEPDDEHPALSACYQAATAGFDLFGPRASAPSLRLVDPSLARPEEPVAIVAGINVHAKLAVHGNDRARLERLCRYLARPPIATERLTRLADGRVRYEMKKAWRDGTRAVLLEPLDLIARVVAMIPPPGFNMTRYFGVLSSHASLRAEVVPEPPAPAENPLTDETGGQMPLPFSGGDGGEDAQPRRRPWAWLLRYVWQTDVSLCSRCDGPMRWVEVATEPDAIARVLAEHGLRARAPPAKRAPSPQLGFAFR